MLQKKQKGLYPVRHKFKGFDHWTSPRGAGNMTVMPGDPEMVFFAPIAAGAGIAASPTIISAVGSAISGINTAGDALAATAAGQRLTSGLNFAANNIGRSKVWPWIDAGLTSIFGAHGIDKVANGDIHNVGDVVETGLDLMPLAQLARPVVNTTSRVGTTIKKTSPQITAENAANITPEQWTAAQDAAIARGDMDEAQRLRDLHFKVNAPNPILSESGNPQKTFHTVGDKYDYKFNQFNQSIEGQHSGVFTTDNPVMSGSYSQKIVSKRVQDDVIEAIRQRELHRYDNYGSGEFYDNLRKKAIKTYSNPKKARKEILKNFPHLNDIEYGRQKELYISLDNPLIINGKGHSWNMIPIEDIPIEMHKYPIVSLDGYGKVASTRTIDRILGGYPETLPKVSYDGAIFRDIVDYGSSSTFVSPKFNKPSTVYDVQNSSNLKLADAVTYDDKGVRIPLGERDNFSKNDIRYSWLAPFIGLGTLGTMYGTSKRKQE